MYSNKTSTSAIVLFLIAALVVFIGYGSAIDGKWFKNSNISTWYNSWGKGETVQTTDNDQNADNTQNNSQNNSGNQNGNQSNSGNQNGSDVTPVQTGNNEEFVIGESQGTGLTLLCAPIDELTSVSLADAPSSYVAAYSLTVTYLPSYATAPVVDYSVAFENPSSTWANGKTATDYVIVIPDSDGALTATAYCLQAFGETTVISVACRNDSSISASVDCDFAQTVTDIYYEAGSQNLSDYFVLADQTPFEPKDLSNHPTGQGWFQNYYDASNGHVAIISNNVAYTVQNSVVSYTCTVTPNQRFLQNLQQAGLTLNPNVGPGNGFSFNGGFGYASFIPYFVESGTFSAQGAFNMSNYNKFITACQNQGSNIAFTVSLTAQMTYGSSITKTFNVSIDSSAAVFGVQQLNFTPAQLVFAE